MKKLLLSLVLAIVGTVMASAQRIPTNDHMTITTCNRAAAAMVGANYISDDLTFVPGASSIPSGYFVFNMVGGQDGVERRYRAYQMDIEFPDGMTFYNNTNPAAAICLPSGINNANFTHAYKGVTVYDDELEEEVTTYNHTLATSYGVIGPNTLRLVTYSNTNQEILSSGALFRLQMRPALGTTPGVYKLHVSNIIFADSQPVEQGSTIEISRGYLMTPFDITFYVDGTGTASLVVNEEAKYGTFVVPGTSTTAIPSGVTAYKCTGTSGVALSLEPETESYFQAGIPYIVHSENAVNTTINYALTGKTVEALANGTTTVNGNNGKLVGVLEEQNVTDGYVLQNQSGNTKFYKIRAAGETIAANRCYLMSDGSSSAPALEFFDLPEVTGINAVETSADKGAVYDMSGRRVNNTVKGGIYIQNGKKVIK